MAYDKTVWHTGDKVTAGKLNKLENAVADLSESSESGGGGGTGGGVIQYYISVSRAPGDSQLVPDLATCRVEHTSIYGKGITDFVNDCFGGIYGSVQVPISIYFYMDNDEVMLVDSVTASLLQGIEGGGDSVEIDGNFCTVTANSGPVIIKLYILSYVSDGSIEGTMNVYDTSGELVISFNVVGEIT